MAEFVIEGGARLHREIVSSGNKNAALPLLAATLLTDQPVTLHNVPAIRDVHSLTKLLMALGATVEWLGLGSVRVHAKDIKSCTLDPDLCREIRASILLAGPMLAREGSVTLPPPGGDVIGRRRLDTHFLALKALGADVRANGNFTLCAKELIGQDMMLDEASVTGTENAIMAAVRARGVTVIRNAASEPHVQDLCHMLVMMGAHIEGIGSNTLTIQGRESFGGAEFTVGADYIEVTSFIVLAALRGDGVWIRKASPEHLRMTRLVLERLGIRFETHGPDVFVPGDQELRVEPEFDGAIPTISDAPWPGFPADSMSLAIIAGTQSEGTVLIHDKMFESRLYFVDRLINLGARIVLCDPHRCIVQGPSRLHGDKLQSPDIRAGVALVMAALCAQGKSTIMNAQQIDRGYERFDEKLRALGAKIERC
jgi:UDP-N-acetylglucosamine 1-carboxyvinyltransferase